jgi:endogenous inhibitor of DNA gyrase (YacG/DUF329 family)
MPVEIKTTIVNCPECKKLSEQRAFACPSCETIVVVSRDSPLNYCPQGGFKLTEDSQNNDRSLVADQINKSLKTAILEAKSSGIL